MNKNTCYVIIGVQILDTHISFSNNWKKKCNNEANYLVKAKGDDNCTFLCCEKCSHNFSLTEYDFTRIK